MQTGCSESEPFALQVLGDSMVPEFADGVIVIVDPAGVVESGRYVVALHEGEYYFRQLVIEDGKYFLKALNENYETLPIPGLDDIRGVVIQQAGRRRKDRKHYD